MDSTEVLLTADEASFRRTAGRSGAALMVATAAVAGAAALLVSGPQIDTAGLWRIAGIALGVACGSIFVPWGRIPQIALAAFPVIGLLLLIQAAGSTSSTGSDFTAFYVLAFAYLGLTQRRWVPLLIGVPVATMAYYLIAQGRIAEIVSVGYVLAIPAAALLGEGLSYFTLRRRRAELGVQKLLTATMMLNRAKTEQEASEVLASLGAQLLEATEVNVCMLGSAASARFGFHKGQAIFLAKGSNPGAASDLPSLRAKEHHEIVFVRESDPETLGERMRVALVGDECSLYAPILGKDAMVLGTMQAIWSSRRGGLDSFTRQVAEVLCMEAGHVFEMVRAGRQLEDEATTDPLTELSNRRTFSHVLGRMEMGDAVVVVDLDHFKKVNDAHGHARGDEVLRDLARAMKDAVREIDCVARFGGEEFAMVLADAGLHGSLALVERIRRSWNASNPLTTFSAGIAVFDGDASVEEIFEQADAALYAAKELGRNRTEVHSPRGTARTDQ